MHMPSAMPYATSLYNAHYICLYGLQQSFLQSYDKVSINSNVYNFSTPIKCVKIHLFHTSKTLIL